MPRLVSQSTVQRDTVTSDAALSAWKGGERHIAIGWLTAMAEGTVRQDTVVYDDISARVTCGEGQLL